MSNAPDQTTDAENPTRSTGCLVGIGFVLFACISFSLAFVWSLPNSPLKQPTSARLMLDYATSREDLEALVTMMSEDQNARAISRMSVDYDYSQPQLDRARIRQYRQTMRRCGITWIIRDDHTGAIWLNVWGNRFTGYWSGYLAGKVRRGAIVSENITEQDAVRGVGFYVMPIEGEWYLFVKDPG